MSLPYDDGTPDRPSAAKSSHSSKKCVANNAAQQSSDHSDSDSMSCVAVSMRAAPEKRPATVVDILHPEDITLLVEEMSKEYKRRNAAAFASAMEPAAKAISSAVQQSTEPRPHKMRRLAPADISR